MKTLIFWHETKLHDLVKMQMQQLVEYIPSLWMKFGDVAYDFRWNDPVANFQVFAPASSFLESF